MFLEKSPRLFTALLLSGCVSGCASAAQKAAPEAAPNGVVGSAPLNVVLAGVDVFGSTKADAEEIIAVAGLKIGSQIATHSDAFKAEAKAAEARLRERFAFPFVKVSAISYFSGPDAGK